MEKYSRVYKQMDYCKIRDEVENIILLYNLRTNKVILINSIGKEIWQFLANWRSKKDILIMLKDRFQIVSEQDCLKDIDNFISKLESNNFILSYNNQAVTNGRL